jgi:tetratricopeptide (TPR) repeat protein
MRFGTGKKYLILLTALLIFFSSACSQVKEENKVDKVQEYTEKAREFRIKGDSQSALKEQLKAVEVNPNDDDSLMLLGGIYIELKQYDKAVEVLQKSTLINSKNAWAFHSLSIALGELDKDKKALEASKKAVEIESANVEFLTFLGANYEEVKDSKSTNFVCLRDVSNSQRDDYSIFTPKPIRQRIQTATLLQNLRRTSAR